MSASQEEKSDSTSPGQSSPDPFVPAAWMRLSEGAFHATIAASRGVAVALFSAPRCGACRVWKQLLPRALSGHADMLFEVDVSEATGVARYYGIFHLPTIYLYRDGRFHAELQCEARADAIRETAIRLLGAAAQEEP